MNGSIFKPIRTETSKTKRLDYFDMSGWNNSPGWNNPYGYPNAGGGGFGPNFNGPRGPHPGMYNMWGPYGGNQMGMVSIKITCKIG